MNSKTRNLILIAMLSAIAYLVVTFFRIPMILFLEYEMKDVVVSIGGFLLGPITAFFISLIVGLVEMFTISATGPIGLFMNVLATSSFACLAAYIYHKNRTMKGAIIGLLSGTVLMTIVMILWNYLITPYYMGIPRQEVTDMLIPVFLPFNLLKGGINTAITLLLYKPVVTTLRKANLLPPSQKTDGKSGINVGLTITCIAVLITCIFLALIIGK